MCTRDLRQDLTAGGVQGLMRPQNGESVISGPGPQCLGHMRPAEPIPTKEEGVT